MKIKSIIYIGVIGLMMQAFVRCEKENVDAEEKANGGNVVVAQTVSYDDAVDLGLSVKWACRNMGAETEVDNGSYYAWGEIIPSDTFSVSTYEHYDSAYVYLGKDISGTKFDAARMTWGGLWRMPTMDEWNELVDSCTWKWRWDFTSFGYEVKGKNGNKIFLPAAGGYIKSEKPDVAYNVKANGYYWTSTYFYVGRASSVYFNTNKPDAKSSQDVYRGLSIRPVVKMK